MLSKNPINRSALILLSALLTVSGAFAAWKYFDAPPLSRYDALLRQMSTRQIDCDGQGRVDVANKFPGLIPKDLAFIRWREDGTFTAMFPTYYGEGMELAGLLYTSRPLQAGDTRNRDSAINFAQQLIGCGTYDNLILEKKINPNWYHVSYKLK